MGGHAPPPDTSTPVEVFESLRSQMRYIKDEYAQAWKWKPLITESADYGKQYLLDYAALLHEAAKQIDRCYFQLAVKPQKMEECMTVMASLETDTEDLWTRLKTYELQLEEASETVEKTIAEQRRISNLLEDKTQECAKFKAMWEDELSRRTDLEAGLRATVVLLEDEKATSETLREKVRDRENEILRLDAAKRERILRAVKQMQGDRSESWMRHVFASFRRVVQLDRLNRLFSGSKNELQSEITRIQEQRQSLSDQLRETQDSLSESQAAVYRLKKDRVECGEKLLKRRYSPDINGVLHTWMGLVPHLKIENKLSLIEEDYDLAAGDREKLAAEMETANEKMRTLSDDFKSLKKTSHQQRISFLMWKFKQAALTTCATWRRDRDAKELTKAHEECEFRGEKVAMLEDYLRNDTLVINLEQRCKDLQYQLDQSLYCPSRICKPDVGVQCATCFRQVVYQNFISAEQNSEPEPISLQLPVLKLSDLQKKHLRNAWH